MTMTNLYKSPCQTTFCEEEETAFKYGFVLDKDTLAEQSADNPLLAKLHEAYTKYGLYR